MSTGASSKLTRHELNEARAQIKKMLARNDVKTAKLLMSELNLKLDVVLGRITTAEYNLCVQDPSRALIRFEAQLAAAKNGTLIL